MHSATMSDVSSHDFSAGISLHQSSLGEVHKLLSAFPFSTCRHQQNLEETAQPHHLLHPEFFMQKASQASAQHIPRSLIV